MARLNQSMTRRGPSTNDAGAMDKMDILDTIDKKFEIRPSAGRVPIGDNGVGTEKHFPNMSLEARETFRYFVQKELDAVVDRIVAENERRSGGQSSRNLPSAQMSQTSKSASIILQEPQELAWPSEDSEDVRNRRGSRRASRRNDKNGVISTLSSLIQGNVPRSSKRSSLTSEMTPTSSRISNKGQMLTVPGSRGPSVCSQLPNVRDRVSALACSSPPGTVDFASGGVAVAGKPPVRSSAQSLFSDPILANSGGGSGGGGVAGGRPQKRNSVESLTLEVPGADEAAPLQDDLLVEACSSELGLDENSQEEGDSLAVASPAVPKHVRKVTGIRFSSEDKGDSETSPHHSEEEISAKLRKPQKTETATSQNSAGATFGPSSQRASFLGAGAACLGGACVGGADDGGERVFALNSTWTTEVKKSYAEAATLGTLLDLSMIDDLHPTKSRWENMIISPSWGPRMLWDVGALIFMAYECVMLPLTFFNLKGEAVNMAGRLFWTCDMPLQFFTGYQTVDGDVEMRPRRVVRNYVRSWFGLDVMLLVIDWLDFVTDSEADVQGARVAKATKSLRMIRLTRMMKLLYVVKNANLPEWVKSIVHKYCSSDVLSGMIGILRIFFLWVWINHVCTCGWFAIASESNGMNWIDFNDFTGASKLYCYVLGYHWSLSLYGSSTDVHPSNLTERIYAVIATLGAFMVGAYIVSATTTSMTRVSIATAQEAKQFSTLKQYLFENGISATTAERVQRNARHAILQKKYMKSESDIDLLEVISQPLRIELHFEIYMRVLDSHPFLDIASEESSTFMRQVCHNALAQITLAHHDLLFDEGEASLHQQMYFINKGGCHYRRSWVRESELARVGDWACEAVLWTSWIHCGSMLAGQDSSLVALESAPFQSIASQFRDCIGYAQRYAVAFCRYIAECDQEELTDLEDPNMDVEWLASKSRVAPEPPGGEGGVMRASLLLTTTAEPSSSGQLTSSSSFKGLFGGGRKKKDDAADSAEKVQQPGGRPTFMIPQDVIHEEVGTSQGTLEDKPVYDSDGSMDVVQPFQLVGRTKKPAATAKIVQPPTVLLPVLPGAA